MVTAGELSETRLIAPFFILRKNKFCYLEPFLVLKDMDNPGVATAGVSKATSQSKATGF